MRACTFLVVFASVAACGGEMNLPPAPAPLHVATEPVTVRYGTSCASGASWNGIACTWDAPAAASGPGAELPDEPLSAEARADAVVDDALEPRHLGHRARALVATEIQGLESLYRVTEARSLDRPLLIRRLAEDYAELEAGVRESGRRAEHRGDHAAAAQEEKTAANAARAAMKNYRLLLDEYAGAPSARFASDPPSPYPLLDEARYFLARELDRGGDALRAQAEYAELLRREPSSRYAAYAQLALGEAALREAASSDFALSRAEDAYRRAFEGARGEPVRAAALLRLAQVDERRGERDRARQRYGRLASEFGREPAATLVPDWAK